ncbi:MAG: DNA methyltransferase [Bacteroidota bacterium]
MAISKHDFSGYIKQFNFRMLFNEMGWNNDKTKQPISVDNFTFSLQAVAEKSGFKILLCPPAERAGNPTDKGLIPDYNTRKKIETKVTKLFQEHLIIFCDAKNQEQIWQLVVRQSGKPTKVTETRYHISQDPELLYQRASGIFFEMDEEEKITIVDVTKRMADNFHANAEKVTKQFYDKFKKEHTSFLNFIKGIDQKVNKEWYASLMLNRLMFCYFIQKKGFLDDNKNYLRDKLNACQVKKGKNKFYSFYRDFLLVLFHQGLNETNQKEEVKIEIGKIPYLNGGLFDEHELEKMYNAIDIEDKAFERIFDFFDQYEWHLDTRITATGKDINPDVIGYIFEKYINDRANMGAYYTKEDITDYISKNCILPYLFDETKRQYPKAFLNDGEIWQSANQSGDIYIYDAVKKGVEEELPAKIATGIKDVSKRIEWNKAAPTKFALPTEIWREVVDRRNRYAEVKNKIEKGEITTINDFITYNLNIRQFAQDVVESTTDHEFLKYFYKSLNNVTIIDPTCGSGAFLFAAMNILEPLYESCIQRMENFVTEAAKGKYKFFEEILEQVKSPEHPNLSYFIYKSIILRNLYGVDIMNEAVEIAKLRLFLKLVATVEVDYRKPNLGLEPLPDIDFNIRAGNTLVGFATEKELEKSLIEDMMGALVKNEIEEKCDIVARAFTRYKEIQLNTGDDYKDFKTAKDDLNKRLKELNHELNLLLHKQAEGLKFEKWIETHQPFHWFAEFYEIIHDKDGFDVVIGNPPYVSLKDVKCKLNNYETVPCGDLYAMCIERAILSLLNSKGRIGMIVPISIVSTDGYSTLRKVCSKSKTGFYYSNFGVRPSKLFDGVDKRLTIFISTNNDPSINFTTKYYRWLSDERENLFSKLSFQDVKDNLFNISGYPKISSDIEKSILKALLNKKLTVSNVIVRSSSNKVRYTRKLQHFIQFFENPPVIYDEHKNKIEPSELKEITVGTANEKDTLLCVLNSNLFFWFFITFSDCRNVNSREILKFPVELDKIDDSILKIMESLSAKLLKDLVENSIFQIRNDKRAGILEIQSFQPRLSKPIIDEIDTVLAEHYGFTAEELDFIINYDIKYRMGKELENGEEE